MLALAKQGSVVVAGQIEEDLPPLEHAGFAQELFVAMEVVPALLLAAGWQEVEVQSKNC